MRQEQLRRLNQQRRALQHIVDIFEVGDEPAPKDIEAAAKHINDPERRARFVERWLEVYYAGPMQDLQTQIQAAYDAVDQRIMEALPSPSFSANGNGRKPVENLTGEAYAVFAKRSPWHQDAVAALEAIGVLFREEPSALGLTNTKITIQCDDLPALAEHSQEIAAHFQSQCP